MSTALLSRRCQHLLAGRRSSRTTVVMPVAWTGADSKAFPKVTAPLTNANLKHTETELVLDQAQHDLAELCNEDVADKASCWRVVDYFAAKRQQYEQHCDLEHEKGEHDAAACSALNNFERFTRENMASGSVKNFVNNLSIMQRAEERRNAAGQSSPSAVPSAMSAEEAAARVALIRLFHSLDVNKDGKLSMMEFQEGMESLCATLTDEDVRAISDALGGGNEDEGEGRGFLDIDAFMDVMHSSAFLTKAVTGAACCDATHHAPSDPNAFLRHSNHLPHTGGPGGAHHAS